MRRTEAPARQALRLCGSGDGAEARERVLALGERAVEEVLEALGAGEAVGGPGANGRAVFEDLEDLLSQVALAHPARWLARVARTPALLERLSVLSATGRVPEPAAGELMLRALESRDGSLRWLALTRLLERGDRRVVPRLGKLLQDRDGLVVFVALGASRRWGGAEQLPELERLARARRTPSGTRDRALDALEAISVRLGRPIPGGRPRLLLEVPLPGAKRLLVIEGSQVAAGEPLAEGPGGPLVSPAAAVVVGIESEGGSIRLILRRLEAP
jgi:hypothetical protein